MPGGLEAETDVAARDDDGLAGEVLFGVGHAPELIVEESDEEVTVI